MTSETTVESKGARTVCLKTTLHEKVAEKCLDRCDQVVI